MILTDKKLLPLGKGSSHNMLGQNKKNNKNFNFKNNKINEFDKDINHINKFKIANKPVYVYNKHPIPKKSRIENVYKKIPDDINIPLHFMTREQYLIKYIDNQEQKHNVDFSARQEHNYLNDEMNEYASIIGRYTTKKNKYYEPAVVIFNDPNNFKNISNNNFDKLVWHEYGHELAEKEKLNLSHNNEEYFADRIADIGISGQYKSDTYAKNKILNHMQKNGMINKNNKINIQNNIINKDNYSKNMAWREQKPYEYVEYMSPREYLTKTKYSNFGKNMDYDEEQNYYDNETERMENINKLSTYIKNSNKDVNLVEVDPKTGEHEGRHRALASERAGFKKIPVKLPAPNTWRTDNIIKEFIDERFGNNRDDSYKNVWYDRIKNESYPENIMDNKSIDVYSNVLKKHNLVNDTDSKNSRYSNVTRKINYTRYTNPENRNIDIYDYDGYKPTIDDISYVIDNYPETYNKSDIKVVPKNKYIKSHPESKNKINNFASLYNPNENIIYVFSDDKNLNPESDKYYQNLRYILTHEIGHSIDNNSEYPLYKDVGVINRNDNDSPSLYAREVYKKNNVILGAKEDTAESFALWNNVASSELYPKQFTGKLDKERNDIFNKNLGDRNVLLSSIDIDLSNENETQ
jgi:hypothetical protein